MEMTELLKSKIEESKSAIALYLAGGYCKSMEEYCRLSGKHAALNEVLDEINQIEKRYIED